MQAKPSTGLVPTDENLPVPADVSNWTVAKIFFKDIVKDIARSAWSIWPVLVSVAELSVWGYLSLFIAPSYCPPKELVGCYLGFGFILVCYIFAFIQPQSDKPAFLQGKPGFPLITSGLVWLVLAIIKLVSIIKGNIQQRIAEAKKQAQLTENRR
jgi:hypothetical protein